MLNDYIEKLASSLEDLYPQLKSHHYVTIALCFANLGASVGDNIKDIKKSDFEAWFEIASEFFLDYKNAFERESFRMAIFYLHQVTESLITCYLLVKD
jgi:hypothetical protein